MSRSTLFTTLFFLLLVISSPVSAKLLSPGDYFPRYDFDPEISSADSAYLGVSETLGRTGKFSLEDIWGEVLVLELFNRYCFSCQQGASILNKAYEIVAADPILSRKVRFLGVGVGNSRKTVIDFGREFDVQFPLVPDPRFSILSATGNPGGTPYTMVLMRTSKGFILTDAYFGVLDSAEDLVARIEEVSTSDAQLLVADAAPGKLPPWVEKELLPPIPDTEIEALVLKSMERAGYGSVGLYTAGLPDGEKAFIGESNRGKVFARVISRLPVCDVCHPVHFILTFNTRGEVVDFDAISVTKYWNVQWDEKEVDQMRRKLLGLSVFQERSFNPAVDAISTATISSSLIFDSIGKTRPIVEILKKGGHL